MPPQLQGVLRIQSIAGTAYLLAHQPFASTRVIVRGLDDGQVYLLDLSASAESAGNAPIEIFLPDQPDADGQETEIRTSSATAIRLRDPDPVRRTATLRTGASAERTARRGACARQARAGRAGTR